MVSEALPDSWGEPPGPDSQEAANLEPGLRLAACWLAEAHYPEWLLQERHF